MKPAPGAGAGRRGGRDDARRLRDSVRPGADDHARRCRDAGPGAERAVRRRRTARPVGSAIPAVEVFLVQAEHLVRGGAEHVAPVSWPAPSCCCSAARRRRSSPPGPGRPSAPRPNSGPPASRAGRPSSISVAAFVEVGGQEQILAVAQVVLTATAVPGVERVRFLLEGEAVEVPRADGTLTSDSLQAADYQGLLRLP